MATLALILGMGLTGYGQYAKGKIEFANGKVEEGYIKTIKNEDEKEITFKSGKDGLITDYPSENLRRVVVYDKNNQDIHYEYHYVTVNSYHGAVGFRRKPKNIWLLLKLEGHPVNLYSYIRKGGAFNSQTLHPDIRKNFYVKKSEDSVATFIASSNDANIILKYDGLKYFKDYTELAEKLTKKDKGYQTKDIISMVTQYNIWKANSL